MLGVLVGLPVAAGLRNVLLFASSLVMGLLTAAAALVAVTQVPVLLAALRVVGLLSTPWLVPLSMALLLTRVLMTLVRPLVTVLLVPLVTAALVLWLMAGRASMLVTALVPLLMTGLVMASSLLLPASLLVSLVLALGLVPGRTLVLVGLLGRRSVVRRLFGLVLLLGTPLQATLTLLLVPARRRGVTARRLVAPAVLLVLSAVRTTVLVVATAVSSPPLFVPASLLVLVALSLHTDALVLVLAAVLLVALMGACVAPSRLCTRSLAYLPATGLFLSVFRSRRVLLVPVAARLVGHFLVPVMRVARAVLLALALLAVVRRGGPVLLLVERFVVGPVVVSCHCDREFLSSCMR